MKRQDLIKVIAIPDIQAPKHDEVAVSTAIEVVKGEKPDILIHIGDLVDFQSISRYPKKDWQEAQLTADEEVESANALLDRFDKVTPKKTTTIYLEGNHDKRLSLFFVQNAANLGQNFRGISLQEQLFFEKRGYKYVPMESQPCCFGKIGFIHGWYTNIHHAKTTVERGGRSLIYGHTHDAQMFTGMHLDLEQPRMALSIGSLCKYRQSYLGGRPMNWIHGIAIVYIDENTGRFWPTFHPIIKGRTVINGKIYGK